MKEEIVKFVSEWNRMCNSIACYGCHIGDETNADNCAQYFKRYPDRIVDTVTAWSEAHPIETYAMKLKKVLPDGNYEEIMNNVCPGYIFGQNSISYSSNCPASCAMCWNSQCEE